MNLFHANMSKSQPLLPLRQDTAAGQRHSKNAVSPHKCEGAVVSDKQLHQSATPKSAGETDDPYLTQTTYRGGCAMSQRQEVAERQCV